MSTEKMVRIKQRVDTKENWETSTIPLLENEIGFCSDDGLIKKGDGLHVWSELPYFSFGALSNNGVILTNYDMNKIYSKNSLAAGEDNIAGRRGFYIESVDWDSTNNITTLTLEPTEDFTSLAIGDNISIGRPFGGNLSAWEEVSNVGVISKLSAKDYSITVNNDIGLRTEYLLEYYPDEPQTHAKNRRINRKLWINTKPQLGNYETAFNCVSCGRQNQSSGDQAMALGRKTKALGNYSLAANEQATANGAASTAVNRATADGKFAFASGNLTAAKGESSFTTGVNTIATNQAETSIGRYNISQPNQIFSIGVGSDNNNRKNAIEITQQGATTINDLIAPGFVAQKAKSDQLGRSIDTTYATKTELTTLEERINNGNYKGEVKNFTDLTGSYEIGDIYKVKNKYWKAPQIFKNLLQYKIELSAYTTFDNYGMGILTPVSIEEQNNMPFKQGDEVDFVLSYVPTHFSDQITLRVEAKIERWSYMNYTDEEKMWALELNFLNPISFDNEMLYGTAYLEKETITCEEYVLVPQNSYIIYNGTKFEPVVDLTLPDSTSEYHVTGNVLDTFENYHIIPVTITSADGSLTNGYIDKNYNWYTSLAAFIDIFNFKSLASTYPPDISIYLHNSFTIDKCIRIRAYPNSINIIGINCTIIANMTAPITINSSTITGIFDIAASAPVIIDNISLRYSSTAAWELTDSRNNDNETCNSNLNGILIRSDSYNITIKNCSVQNAPGSGICTEDACRDLRFINNNFKHNRNNGIIINYNAASGIISRVLIQDCYFQQCYGLTADHTTSTTSAKTYNTITLRGSIAFCRIINCQCKDTVLLDDDGIIVNSNGLSDNRNSKGIIRKRNYNNPNSDTLYQRADVQIDDITAQDFRLLL